MKKIICLFMIFIFSFSFAETTLDLKSKSAFLIEATTGEVLYAKNEHEKLRPASVTKVMTLLLIMEALENGSITLDEKVPCSVNARNMGGSQIWLDPREELSVNDMLKAICVVSANDCSVAMAEYLAGSEEAFVEKMNLRAKELGMNDTAFKNCHGIDEDGHLTSAHDIGIMSKELLKHKKIFDYTTIWMDTLRDGKSQLVNTNKLLKTYQGANGLKTGSTSLALYNLSATAKRNDMQLIGVIMAAPTTADRFNDATKLLDYGFANYSIQKMGEKGSKVGVAKVSKGEEKEVVGIVAEEYARLMKKGETKEIEKEIIFNEVSAPINVGDKIGEMIYKQNGEELKRVDIVAMDEVKKLSFGKIFANLMKEWVLVGR